MTKESGNPALTVIRFVALGLLLLAIREAPEYFRKHLLETERANKEKYYILDRGYPFEGVPEFDSIEDCEASKKEARQDAMRCLPNHWLEYGVTLEFDSIEDCEASKREARQDGMSATAIAALEESLVYKLGGEACQPIGCVCLARWR